MKQTWLFPTLIITGAAFLAIASAWNESPIVDEIPHIGAGYSYIEKSDMRLNPEHPPLVKDLAGIALHFLRIQKTAFLTPYWLTDINGQWNFGRTLIYESGNDADLITRVARLPVIIFFILSAVMVFVWGKKLFGPVGAAIALVLFVFSPTIMAHARYVTTDIAALFGILSGTYFFLRYLKTPNKKNFLIGAGVFGIALACKFSTFLLVPFLGFVAVVWGLVNAGNWREKLNEAFLWGARSVALFVVGFVAVVWPLYGLQTYHYPPERQHRDTQQILQTFTKRSIANAIIWASDKPYIRAADHYVLGLVMTARRSAEDNTIFFLGRVVQTGGPIYFPLVYFLKEPLAWWLLACIAVMLPILRDASPRRTARRIRYATAAQNWIREHIDVFAMLVWLALYWTISIRSQLNIGVRHILPTYPFALLLVAGQLAHAADSIRRHDRERFRMFGYAIAFLVGWYVYENISVFPSYLSYFNQVAGGPTGGYQFVTDSNLDWGQDAKHLAQWVQAHDVSRIEVDYFGWADPAYYLQDRYRWTSSTTYRDAKDFLSRNQTDGWIAVSATFLQGSVGNELAPITYTWLKAYQPETVIGNSIFVWHIVR